MIVYFTWGVIPGWEDIICSDGFMIPGLLSEGLLVDPPVLLTFLPHDILWHLSNSEATQGGQPVIPQTKYPVS